MEAGTGRIVAAVLTDSNYVDTHRETASRRLLSR
jgi:hypothetical protein